MSDQQKAPAVPNSIMTPEAQAYMNQSIASAVSEAMKQAMAVFAPVLHSVALTPERIQELKKPYEDPAKAARELRDRKQMKMQVEEQQRNEAMKKAACLHRYKTGMEAIQLVHNFPD